MPDIHFAESAAQQKGYIKTIGVFCGSLCGDDPQYVITAYEFGRWATQQNFQIAYGGGKSGTMGALNDGVLVEGGKSTIINLAIFEDSDIHSFNRRAHARHAEKTTYDRTRRFIKECDVLVALAGGSGTIEEIVTTFSAGDLSEYEGHKGFLPQLLILNQNGIYDGLQAVYADTTARGFTESAGLNG